MPSSSSQVRKEVHNLILPACTVLNSKDSRMEMAVRASTQTCWKCNFHQEILQRARTTCKLAKLCMVGMGCDPVTIWIDNDRTLFAIASDYAKDLYIICDYEKGLLIIFK
jgi:hypothetical protein